MTSDELKRILLIMGVKDPAIKMSVRQIMNRMDSNESLSSVFASQTPPGFDRKRWEDTKKRMLEQAQRGYVWTGYGISTGDTATAEEELALKELQHEGKVVWRPNKGYTTPDFLSRWADSNVPKTVKRYVEEHLEQGNDEGKAWALAWSRYCQYSNPDSPRCKQDDYFHGKGKSSSQRIANEVAKEFAEQLADEGREISLKFERNSAGAAKVSLTFDGTPGSIVPIPADFATFARTVDYYMAPDGDVTDIERHITEMKGEVYKEASRVASLWLRFAYMVNLPAQTRNKAFSELQKLVRQGLSPFPTTDPQRIETQIAKEVRSDVQGLGASISMEGAHEFVRSLLREAEIDLDARGFEQAVSDLGIDTDLLDRRLMGKLVSHLNEMLQGLSEDASRGSVRGQQQVLRLFLRHLPVEEWEAQQLLSEIASSVKINVALAPDQVDLLLTSYMD